MRPKLVDGFKNTYLLDSGSMTCVWPATKTDKIDETVRLQSVDGTRFACYGRKKLDIRIGRKNYSIEAVIAKVKTPLLGWDFFMKYRLDLIWGDFGDLFLYDRVAQIQGLLNVKDLRRVFHKNIKTWPCWLKNED